MSILGQTRNRDLSKLLESLEELRTGGFPELTSTFTPVGKVALYHKIFEVFGTPPVELGYKNPSSTPLATNQSPPPSSSHHSHANMRAQDKGKGKATMANPNPEPPNPLENLPIPAHFDTICQGSLLEYKELLSKRHRAQEVLHKYEADFKENSIPNSLRINPPRITINNENAQNLLNQKLQELTSEYRKNCTMALIDAQQTLAISFTETLNNFPNIVEKRLQDIATMLLDIPLHNLATTQQWEEKLQQWKHETFTKLSNELEKATLEFSIQISLEAKTRAANQSARETIISKSMTMDKEKTVSTLIDDGLKKIKNQVDNYLQPFLEKINKGNPKNGGPPLPKNRGAPKSHNYTRTPHVPPTAPTSSLQAQSFIPNYGQSYAHPAPPSYLGSRTVKAPTFTHRPSPATQPQSHQATHTRTFKPSTQRPAPYPRPSTYPYTTNTHITRQNPPLLPNPQTHTNHLGIDLGAYIGSHSSNHRSTSTFY